MIRLIKLPPKKYAKQSLLTLYGINHCTANKIIGIFRLHPRAREKYLRKPRIRDLIQDTLAPLRINFRLRLIVFSRLCLLIATNSYRGMRLMQGLPTHGQRTHANGRSLSNLKLSGKLFPFKIKNLKAKTAVKKKYGKSDKGGKGGKGQTAKKTKITAKQKARIKAKNKTKAKAAKRKTK